MNLLFYKNCIYKATKQKGIIEQEHEIGLFWLKSEIQLNLV